MAFPSYTQDPQDRLDYEIDWSEWLPTGDTIISSAWSVDDADLTLDDATATSTTATVFASGGVLGNAYLVTNHIETGQGREKDQTIKIKIRTQ